MIGYRGSVLLEGAFALSLIFFSMTLAFEICRRSWIEITLQHGAFLAARDTILGEPREATFRKLRSFAQSALGENWGRRLAAQFRESASENLAPGYARLKFRFPALLRFPVAKHWKHHFEITHVCRFPFSS